MNIKQIINNNIPKINELIKKIESNNYPDIEKEIYNQGLLTEKTISIVMTTHNRIKQTLFTLKTIQESAFKDIQVIIVDDSDKGFIENLSDFSFHINYIKILKKEWTNPCVNYNIGFHEVRGGIIIIQNAEVCHIGDIINYVNNNLNENEYMCFDVCVYNSFKANNDFYSSKGRYEDALYALYNNPHNMYWYQHSVKRNKNYHFLTAIKKNDFKKLGYGFDYDFALGTYFDDDEFLNRIKNVLKLKIINVTNENTKLLGLHLYHQKEYSSHKTGDFYHINKFIFEHKKKYYEKNNKYLFLYKGDTLED